MKNNSLLRKDFRRGQIPAGPRGAVGPAGPAGAAKAFTRVLASGDVDEPRARGIADAAVSKPTPGVYCIDVEGGAQNVVATVDTSLNAPASILASALLTSCPAGKEVEVHTFDEVGLATDLGFYVLIN